MYVAAAAAAGGGGNEAVWVGGNHKYEYFTVAWIRHVATSPVLLTCVIITILWHVSHHFLQQNTRQGVTSYAFTQANQQSFFSNAIC